MNADVEQIARTAVPGRIVVVGAGAVGLYAAAQLAARGRQVVLLEAGEPCLGSFDADSYASIGRPHSGIRIGRSRSVGGTTNLWGGQLVEFQPIDFNGRDWLPGSKWPVSYDEIAPYYKPTYLNLGIPEQFISDEAVWRGLSSPQPDLGSEFEVFFTRWMSTPNFAELFAAQLQSDPNLQLVTDATATGFRSEGGRISAVRVTSSKQQSHWVTAETVILAAGAIENVRLLLHAANDPSFAAPWRENQNVGRYFQDHLAGKIGSFDPANKRDFFRMFTNVVYSGRKFMPKIRMRNVAQEKQKIYNTQVFFAFESEISEHMVYLKQFLKAALYNRKLIGGRDVLRNGFGVARYLFPLMWKYVWDHRIFVPTTARIDMHVQAEHAPVRDSRITVDPASLDTYGLPRVLLNWQIGSDEIASLHSFATQISGALESHGIGKLKLDDELLASNPAFLSKLGDIYHQSGGTNMADSPDRGVVDRDLRVFGTENLYVAGAGTFPTTSNANTTFTAITFTTRLVDHLTGTRSID
ncbi:MAG TPA: GMC family oxidoreductase [Acidobacteriaceae bacterium]|nr:GMC family oxidoreductase [Acidobacteriaceae bacterium]